MDNNENTTSPIVQVRTYNPDACGPTLPRALELLDHGKFSVQIGAKRIGVMMGAEQRMRLAAHLIGSVPALKCAEHWKQSGMERFAAMMRTCSVEDPNDTKPE